MRHNYIGTEHLLLALLREKDGLAKRILREVGLNLEDMRRQVMEYLAPDKPDDLAERKHDAMSVSQSQRFMSQSQVNVTVAS
jgi:ATP-dependent Clp protease ATP-binding subunit ClpA